MLKLVLKLVLLLALFAFTRPTTESSLISFSRTKIIPYPFTGHGVQWSAYPHGDSEDSEWGLLITDEKWKMLYDRLDFIGPRIIRVMDDASWRYYKGLDHKGKPIIDFDNQELKSLYKLLDYCQTRDIPVLLGEWGSPDYKKENDSVPGIYLASDDRWIDMIIQFVEHLVIDKGYRCIKYYNLVNEPNGYWASTNGDWDQWKEGYMKLGRAFKEGGLDKYVQLAGPDIVAQWDHPTHPKKAFDWFYDTTKELDDLTGMYEVHIYADQDLIHRGNLTRFLTPLASSVKKTEKPLLIGELGMKYTGALQEENKRRAEADPCAGIEDSNMFIYDYKYGVDLVDAALQAMLAGFGGSIAWNLDDAMHTVGDKGDRSQLKKWGMWNILGQELCGDINEMSLRPWSYSWTLMCRLMEPGSKIIAPEFGIENGNEDVRAVATLSEKELTIVVLNKSLEEKSFRIKTDLNKRALRYYIYEYAEKDLTKNQQGFPLPTKSLELDLDRDGFELTVAPNSIIFISTIETT